MDVHDFIVNRDQHMRPLEYDLSENFNELMRYLNDMGVLGNVPVGVTSEAEIVSISDEYPAPPRALTVFGKSTQDGTPTPYAPVPILSVDALTIHASADGGTTDYTSWPVADLLPENTKLRSLPSGTRDQLTLSYLRPSTRLGWAWYSRELVRRIGEITFNEFASLTARPNVNANDFRPSAATIAPSAVYKSTASGNSNRMRCNSFRPTTDLTTVPSSSGYNGRCSYQQNSRFAWFRLDSTEYPDLETANAWLADNPITIFLEYRDGYEPDPVNLDPIELPTLPAPNCTIWCDGDSAQPTMVLEYVRDTNATIAELSEAIADIVSG